MFKFDFFDNDEDASAEATPSFLTTQQASNDSPADNLGHGAGNPQTSKQGLPFGGDNIETSNIQSDGAEAVPHEQRVLFTSLQVDTSDLKLPVRTWNPIEEATSRKRKHDQDFESNLLSKVTQRADVLHGVYEGGLKQWECAVDLVKYLQSALTLETSTTPSTTASASTTPSDEAVLCRIAQKLIGGRVVDLGCGQGLPGITALANGASVVVFQDLNKDVLLSTTYPRILSGRGTSAFLPRLSFSSSPQTSIASSSSSSAADQGQSHLISSIIRRLDRVPIRLSSLSPLSSSQHSATHDISTWWPPLGGVSSLSSSYEHMKITTLSKYFTRPQLNTSKDKLLESPEVTKIELTQQLDNHSQVSGRRKTNEAGKTGAGEENRNVERDALAGEKAVNASEGNSETKDGSERDDGEGNGNDVDDNIEEDEDDGDVLSFLDETEHDLDLQAYTIEFPNKDGSNSGCGLGCGQSLNRCDEETGLYVIPKLISEGMIRMITDGITQAEAEREVEGKGCHKDRVATEKDDEKNETGSDNPSGTIEEVGDTLRDTRPTSSSMSPSLRLLPSTLVQASLGRVSIGRFHPVPLSSCTSVGRDHDLVYQWNGASQGGSEEGPTTIEAGAAVNSFDLKRSLIAGHVEWVRVMNRVCRSRAVLVSGNWSDRVKLQSEIAKAECGPIYTCHSSRDITSDTHPSEANSTGKKDTLTSYIEDVGHQTKDDLVSIQVDLKDKQMLDKVTKVTGYARPCRYLGNHDSNGDVDYYTHPLVQRPNTAVLVCQKKAKGRDDTQADATPTVPTNEDGDGHDDADDIMGVVVYSPSHHTIDLLTVTATSYPSQSIVHSLLTGVRQLAGLAKGLPVSITADVYASDALITHKEYQHYMERSWVCLYTFTTTHTPTPSSAITPTESCSSCGLPAHTLYKLLSLSLPSLPLSSSPQAALSADSPSSSPSPMTLPDVSLFDLILSADTIYQSAYIPQLVQSILGLLKKDGIALVGAKRYYFGVGGSTRALMEEVDRQGGKSQVVKLINDGVSNVREVIMVTHKSQ